MSKGSGNPPQSHDMAADASANVVNRSTHSLAPRPDVLTRVTARPAPLAVRHFESVWGTVVGFDVRDHAVRGVPRTHIHAAISDAVRWLHRVDRIFSTYRDDSVVTAYRRGVNSEQLRAQFPSEDVDEFTAVVGLCEHARMATDGAFNPWAVPEGFDPSGIVKGWAVARAADILRAHHLDFFLIDGSGDMVCAGGEDVGVPWHIGIRHPDFVDSVMKAFTLNSGATATSGTYERGAHIVNPLGHGAALTARAATVVGPDAALCEVWATALVVRGSAALPQVAALGAQWSALVVIDDRVVSVGSAFG